MGWNKANFKFGIFLLISAWDLVVHDGRKKPFHLENLKLVISLKLHEKFIYSKCNDIRNRFSS